ncbi:hypothetical protein EAY41_21450 [Escherichia coli]|nr:hypothetical protein [Escherichia coli]
MLNDIQTYHRRINAAFSCLICRFDSCRGHHLSVRSHPYQSAKFPEYQAFRRFTVRNSSLQIVDSRTP